MPQQQTIKQTINVEINNVFCMDDVICEFFIMFL